MQYDSLKRMPAGGLASFLTSNMDEIEDNVLAFGAPRGINSMVDVGNRMASLGRNGDDQLVHMRTGEIAVSPELLEENPRLAGALANAFQRSNVDMDRYVVGSGANSINPMTGQPEFFLKKLVRGIKNVFKKDKENEEDDPELLGSDVDDVPDKLERFRQAKTNNKFVKHK